LNILIVGAGAIGCLVGGKLASSSYTVTLVGRPAFAELVRAQNGLFIAEGAQTQHIAHITAVGSVADAFARRNADFNLIILTVKSYDTATAVAELTQQLPRDAAVMPIFISLQNGVGNEEQIAHAFDAAHVIAGVITTPVSVTAPATIRVEKSNYDIGISPWHPAMSQSWLGAVQTALQRAGFSGVVYPDAQGLKWTKLLMNMLGNATSAILDMPPDAIFADPQLADLEIDAWREALLVMRTANIPPVNIGNYSFSLIAPFVRYAPKFLLRQMLRSQMGRARGGKMPSLHIDLARGRRQNEVTWLNGAVVKKGEEVGVATPVNRMLTETLLTLVRQPEQRDLWRSSTARMVVTAEEYRSASSG